MIYIVVIRKKIYIKFKNKKCFPIAKPKKYKRQNMEKKKKKPRNPAVVKKTTGQTFQSQKPAVFLCWVVFG